MNYRTKVFLRIGVRAPFCKVEALMEDRKVRLSFFAGQGRLEEWYEKLH